MLSWRGFFTENEALELVKCVEEYGVTVGPEHNKDILRDGISRLLGDNPLTHSIIGKIDMLNEQQVIEVMDACRKISAKTCYNSAEDLKYRDRVDDNREALISHVFNPQ